MFGLLKDAYAKNASELGIFAFMAVIYIIKGRSVEAGMTLSRVEAQMSYMVSRLREFIK